MSRGYDLDDRGNRNQEPEQPARSPRPAATQTRDSSKQLDDRAKQRLSNRALEKWSALTERERGTLREVGRFRTMDTEALLESRYAGRTSALREEVFRLQRQGPLQRRSLSVGKNRDNLVILALTKDGARLVWQDGQLPEFQAVYADFVKPTEVPHDAAIYRMYRAEAEQLEAKGGKVRRVVLDYELKRNVYSKLARERIPARSNTRGDNRKSPTMNDCP